MAVVSAVSRRHWQRLMRAAAPSCSHLLSRERRWFSDRPQAVSPELPTPPLGPIRKEDEWVLRNVGKVIRTINPESLVECKQRVGVVASEIECLCSWNIATRPSPAIVVPGDVRRPVPRGRPLADASNSDPSSKSLSRDGPESKKDRWNTWMDTFVALLAMKPDLTLNNVDIMDDANALVYLFGIAQSNVGALFAFPGKQAFAFDLSLFNDTLVIQQRRDPISPPVGGGRWDHYETATTPILGTHDSSNHSQLLRYNIGPLSCIVRVVVNGSVQGLPTSTRSPEPRQTLTLHGVEVIPAGHGVSPASTFKVRIRNRPENDTMWKREHERLKRMDMRGWLAGQTRVGLVDMLPALPGAPEGPPGAWTNAQRLTVVEMGDRIEAFEKEKQSALRRFATLLETLRDTVQAHGGPCVAVHYRTEKKTGNERRNNLLHIYSAGPEELPVLLEWQKEQFWS